MLARLCFRFMAVWDNGQLLYVGSYIYCKIWHSVFDIIVKLFFLPSFFVGRPII